MEPAFIQHPRRWFALWAAVIVLGFAGVQGVNQALLAYSEHVRANDYMTFVDEAAHLAESGRIEEAFVSLRRALELAPSAPEPHLLKGHLHYRNQQWEEALAAYRRALQHGTGEVGARLNAVWAMIQLGRYADAVALGEVSIRSGFDSPTMARFIGEALVRAEDYEAAVPYIEQALDGYPNDLYLWQQLADTARRLGDERRETRARDRIQAIQSRLDAVTGAGL